MFSKNVFHHLSSAIQFLINWLKSLAIYHSVCSNDDDDEDNDVDDDACV